MSLVASAQPDDEVEDAVTRTEPVAHADGNVLLHGAPGTARLRHEVMLAGRRARWTSEADADGVGTAPLVVPREAFVHEEGRRYLADATTMVTFADGFVAAGPPLFVAWPDGPDGAAWVIAAEDQEVVAPNGVLDPTLREGLVDPSIFLVPDLGDPPASGRGPEADAEVAP